MEFSEFVGQVQNRLELPGEGEALRATRAVLTALGERIDEGEASDLAGPLPMEIDRFLTEADSGESFSYDEFLVRVGEAAGVDESAAQHYAQEVLAVASDSVPAGELEQVRAQLPEEFDPLFVRVDAAE